jgi:CHAT domain-containing protein
MKRVNKFVQRKGKFILRLQASHWIVFLLTLFFVTTVLPVAAQYSSQLSLPLLSEQPKSRFLAGRGIPSGKSQVDASTQLAQGRTLYEAGRFAEAATLWQEVAQGYTAQNDALNQALCLSYLALAYQDLGQWQAAEKAIHQSLERLNNLELTTQNSKLIFAHTLNTQGSLQLARGQAQAALDTWKQAQEAYTDAGDDIGRLGSQINQAQALQTLGLYRRAQTTLEQVNKDLQAYPDSLLKATGLRSLGVALQVVGDLQKSQEVLEQSLAIIQRLDSSLDESEFFFSLGNTARDLQDYTTALDLYTQAATHATNPITKLEAQLNQLSLNLQLKQWDAAQASLPQIQSQLPNLPVSHDAVYAQVNLAESLMKWSVVNGNPLHTTDIAKLLATAAQQAKMLEDPRAESYTLGQLGQLYKQTQQWEDAQNLTQQALQIAQSINASDTAYRWQWQLGQILKQQGKLSEATAAYTEAVNTLQFLRSDLVTINPNIQFSFRESVEPVYRELVQLLLQPPRNQGEVSQENLNKARQVIESLQLAELDNFFRQACLSAKPEQIDQVDPTAAVIYPIILPERLAVIVSLPGQPLRYYQTQLPQSEVESLLEQLLQSLNPAFSNKERLRLSQQVYTWLIQPAERELVASGVKTLVFVLDGTLRNLPMAALYDGQQYLVENYSIALSPGLQLLEVRSLIREQLKVLTGGLTEARQGFSALPAVESELQEISSVLPSKLLLNQQFIKTTLEEQINDFPFPIIHLATHSQFSSKAEETFLLTWDGRVNVKDLDQLLQSRNQNNINPIELLVLSACQTATGDKQAALGLAGFAVRSGARSTLATLWSVRDESTAELMAEFYQALAQTEVSKAEALRQAQLVLLHKAPYEHPFYWAPFVLIGNWL